MLLLPVYGWVSGKRSERVEVIEALEGVCASRQAVSLMNRWLRPEPTQLLQGIVGSRVVITEISFPP